MKVMTSVKEKPLVLLVALALLTTANLSVADVSKPPSSKIISNGDYAVYDTDTVKSSTFEKAIKRVLYDSSLAQENIFSDKATLWVVDNAESKGNAFFGYSRQSLGALTSYSKSSVKQRGESSLASSYGVGLYSTYLSSVGNYIDDVVKFNHFNNELRTHTERDQSVKGSYHQNGYGASLEAGYPYSLADGISIDPYVRAAYFSAQGKDMALSNGMQADIGTQKSAKGELGVSVGKALTLHSLILSPYVTAAAEHEFLENNSVTFNDHYSYKNDQSGTLGKYGIGMTAQLTKNTQAYMEADYRKGSKVESPIMANVGFRINC